MEVLTFIFLSIGIIIIPGPNVLVIISTSLSYGKVRGLQAVAGTSCAMAIQLAIAALGTSYFVGVISEGLTILKWLGVAYLLYFGIRQLMQLVSAKYAELQISALGSFQRGFWVSLTNPKTLLFFSTFLPLFAVSSSSYINQVLILSLIFWLLAVLLDSMYALWSGSLFGILASQKCSKYQHSFAGAVYCTASILLASSKNA